MDPPILGLPEYPILLNVRLVYTKNPRAVVFWESTLVEGGNTNSRFRQSFPPIRPWAFRRVTGGGKR